MLGKTSIAAIRSLMFLAAQDRGECWSPRRLADVLDESPTYLAKVVRHLVKQGILEAEKGVKGGVRLVRAPEEVTLLAIVEACHGTIVGDYCRSARPDTAYCNFHRAALELHEAIRGVLGRWTLADLLRQPVAAGAALGSVPCLMAGANGATARLEAGR
jgi:Rrf2 family protein